MQLSTFLRKNYERKFSNDNSLDSVDIVLVYLWTFTQLSANYDVRIISYNVTVSVDFFNTIKTINTPCLSKLRSECLIKTISKVYKIAPVLSAPAIVCCCDNKRSFQSGMWLNTKSVNAAEIHQKYCEMYEATAVKELWVKQWYRQFNEGRTDVHDEREVGSLKSSVQADDLQQVNVLYHQHSSTVYCTDDSVQNCYWTTETKTNLCPASWLVMEQNSNPCNGIIQIHGSKKFNRMGFTHCLEYSAINSTSSFTSSSVLVQGERRADNGSAKLAEIPVAEVYAQNIKTIVSRQWDNGCRKIK